MSKNFMSKNFMSKNFMLKNIMSKNFIYKNFTSKNFFIRMRKSEEGFTKYAMSALLVSKLSKEDFNIIGLSDRQKIMELRIKCSTFGSKQPERELKSDRKDAPKFKLTKTILEDLLDGGFKVFEIAALMVVSERTIYRRLKEYNIQV